MGVTSLLAARGLERRYSGRLVVQVTELDLAAGEVLAILGPNGAGKSTLFRLLLLLERADAGVILFAGREVRPGDAQALRRMAGVFQRPHLFAGTVASNVEFGLGGRGLPRTQRRQRTARALEWLGLSALAASPVQSLSGGEAQRVALARALVLEPEILMLDEPTANLDVTTRRRFREDLERLTRAHAGAALLITHDPTDAFALADRIAVMDGGRIVQVGSPEELVLNPATPFVAAFTGAELLLDGVVREREEGLVTVQVGGARLLATAAAGESELLAAGSPVHVAYRPEDVLLARTEPVPETSARNRFTLQVAATAPAGALVRARLEGELRLAALLTRRSAESLGLAPGVAVSVQLKATALRAFPAAGRRASGA
ncbi:MAG: ABC transporter ATP-binding protein [Gemmatimonadetes bacterium]|nr:ABC transporter ATP-binding protein [Gemmatimonadota bacterium]